MIKLTHYERHGTASSSVYIAPQHIVSVQSANPSGALVATVRGGFHVAQSADQVLTLMEGKE